MSGIVNSTGAKSGVIGTTVGSVTAASLSGVLPVGVTGGSGLTALGTVTAGNISHANIVYPSGHITNIFTFSKADTTGYSEYTHFENSTKVSQTALSWSAIDTRKYHIFSSMGHWPWIGSGTTTAVYGDVKLWWGVTARAQGATQTGDNLITTARVGRAVPSSAGRHMYVQTTLQGTFTAASTATHYVYQTAISATGQTYFRAMAIAQAPWQVTIFETMP